ncbi:MAG: hypothetical protein ACE5H8_06750 [Alphaproteobacteria bacterium]
MDQPRDELNDLRREARSDGLNLDAVNALVPILAKYPHDKGAGVLNELIRYAGAFGTELAVAGANASPQPANDPASDERVPEPPSPAAPASAVPTPRPGASAPLRLASQVVVAVSVSIGLIWLLN